MTHKNCFGNTHLLVKECSTYMLTLSCSANIIWAPTISQSAKFFLSANVSDWIDPVSQGKKRRAPNQVTAQVWAKAGATGKNQKYTNDLNRTHHQIYEIQKNSEAFGYCSAGCFIIVLGLTSGLSVESVIQVTRGGFLKQ